jgi:hypothetical protein
MSDRRIMAILSVLAVLAWTVGSGTAAPPDDGSSEATVRVRVEVGAAHAAPDQTEGAPTAKGEKKAEEEKKDEAAKKKPAAAAQHGWATLCVYAPAEALVQVCGHWTSSYSHYLGGRHLAGGHHIRITGLTPGEPEVITVSAVHQGQTVTKPARVLAYSPSCVCFASSEFTDEKKVSASIMFVSATGAATAGTPRPAAVPSAHQFQFAEPDDDLRAVVRYELAGVGAFQMDRAKAPAELTVIYKCSDADLFTKGTRPAKLKLILTWTGKKVGGNVKEKEPVTVEVRDVGVNFEDVKDQVLEKRATVTFYTRKKDSAGNVTEDGLLLDIEKAIRDYGISSHDKPPHMELGGKILDFAGGGNLGNPVRIELEEAKQ